MKRPLVEFPEWVKRGSRIRWRFRDVGPIGGPSVPGQINESEIKFTDRRKGRVYFVGETYGFWVWLDQVEKVG